jgi:nucleotide-binding universal stress UspA family protein
MSSTADNKVQPERIVVGVDGSKPARAALAWAATQAALTAAPLTVITTWSYPTSYGYPMAWPTDMDFAADAKSELEASIHDVLGTNPPVKITASVIEGHPSLVLVDASKSAALVVVGSRGHGEFTGMLLGSVSEFVATHAHCPVVIIRESDESGATA